MRLMLKVFVLLIPLAILSCQRPVAPDVYDVRLDPLAIAPGSQRFIIDAADSQLLVFAYREGRLASLGHNHVISSNGLGGNVYLASETAKSAVEIRVPVDSFEVDRPELRAAAGGDFSVQPDAQSIAGTRANMLGDKQLDVAAWPVITLLSRSITGELPKLALSVDIAVKSAVRRVDVPVVVTTEGKRLTVTGEFSVLQTELGLEPFSALLGALSVRDRLDIRFRIVAVQAR